MPQSNSNLQSYAKLPAAKNNSPKIPQISQNISLRLSLMPHTELTDPKKQRGCEIKKRARISQSKPTQENILNIIAGFAHHWATRSINN